MVPADDRQSLTRAEFWSLLTPEEQEGVNLLAEAFGPLEFVEAWQEEGND